MPLDQLKEQLIQLPEEEQREVITFLIARLAEVDDDFKDLAATGDDDECAAHRDEYRDSSAKGRE